MVPAALTVDRVTKRFGAITAVSDVSLAIPDGEIFALLGPNGAGKSTLLRMIVGLIGPDTGSVSRPSIDAGGRIGYLPEERGLYQDMPILRTVTYFGKLHGMSSRDAAEQGAHWLDRLGLGDRGRDKVKTLSKGNQQKVQFAASILHRPKLAILDEPFSGLDPLNQELFLDLVRELRAAGTTVIFSAHQMTLVERLADRVFLMSRGRQVLSGTIAELRKQWHAGERLVIGLGTPAPANVLHSNAAVDAVEEQTDTEIRLRLRADANLSQLLATLGQQLDVRYVRSEAATLHEIYVRTVEADTAGQASPS